MSHPLRWGVLSTARIGATVVETDRGCEATEFVAVAGRDVARARDFASRHGLAQARVLEAVDLSGRSGGPVEVPS